MTLDEIRSKADVARRQIEELERIPQASYEEFAGDFRNLPCALHLLQTTIQALIDIASFAASRLGVGAPSSSLDVLVRLEEGGHLPVGSANRFAPVIGFRNRVVHLYARIDARIVYRVVTKDREDLEELLRLLLAALEPSDAKG